MARQEFDPDQIWSSAVDIIVKSVRNNKSVALLCLGDPSLYASSSNILRIINNNYPDIITRTIPGISSISAAAALSNFDLLKKGETLIIKECPSSKSELTRLIKNNGLSINKEKILNDEFDISKNLKFDKYLLLQKGKKNYTFIIVE